ncbi:MAG TPA: TIM44-like domain-containing protein, partial [Kofleriaceae bacterium]|nr:TIM44-like domain-containing protein [Kofleriaceae bacterium]
MTRWQLALLAAGAALLALAEDGGARPGGGEGYSGGGGGGGGGGYSGGGGGGGYSGGGGDGGGGGGEIIYLLVRLLFEVPQIGVPLLVAVVVAYVWIKRSSAVNAAASWDSVELLPPPPPPSIELVQSLDPGFSPVLFEDFLFRLYGQAHRARGNPEAMAALAPYVSEQARLALAQRAPGHPVEDVVIGTLRISDVKMPPAGRTSGDGKPFYVKIWIDVEANMTVGSGGDRRNHYVRERWRLARMAEAKSRPPARTRDFNCPNCGAPFQSSDGQTCGHCGEVVANGRFEWVVAGVELQHVEDRPPNLTGYAVEQGTYGATIEHPALQQRLATLKNDDSAFTDKAFADRLALIYREINAGWSEQDLARMRPYTSDGLQDYLRYWIEAYRRQGLVNKLEKASMTSWRYAKVTRDAHYDAVTVRFWASGLDYTVRADGGKVVGGSPSAPRTYSEYWTLIRGAAVRGA